MSISCRTFLKVLGSGLAATGLTEVICKRSGWAAPIRPAKIKDAASCLFPGDLL